MTLDALARAGRVDTRHVVIACQALARQLRDVHRAARDGGATDELRAAHVETCETLLNLLAVVDADGGHVAEAARLHGILAAALRDAPKRGFSA